MKRLIASLASAIFVIGLTFMTIGPVFAADTKDTEEKTYRDEDLSKSKKMDEDKSTLNKMESDKQSSEGSAAGGVRGEDESKKSEGSEYKGGDEKMPDSPQKTPDKPYKW